MYNCLYFLRYWVSALQLFLNQIVAKINLIFQINLFLYVTKKIKAKTFIPWEQKELLNWNKKHFSSFLKGFQFPKLVSNLRMRF